MGVDPDPPRRRSRQAEPTQLSVGRGARALAMPLQVPDARLVAASTPNLQAGRVNSKEELVEQLLVFPEIHPYTKWTGTHWRLVEVADSAVAVDRDRLEVAVRTELAWLLPGLDPSRVLRVAGRARRHGSIEGNAVYALCRLGFADHAGTRQLVEALIDWQWPDGGWNCDRHPDANRSSFHESAIPALGLATYSEVTGDGAARRTAEQAAELLLEHRLFRSRRTGEPIHPSWTMLHYPPYWHYDVLQGLRVLAAVDRLGDQRAVDALDLVGHTRRPNGRFAGRRWSSGAQPAAVEWGRGTDNLLLTEIANSVLVAAGRHSNDPAIPSSQSTSAELQPQSSLPESGELPPG